MINIKNWVGTVMESAVKERIQSKLTFATSILILTFFLALIGFVLSIVALTRNFSNVDYLSKKLQEDFIYVNGNQYCRV